MGWKFQASKDTHIFFNLPNHPTEFKFFFFFNIKHLLNSFSRKKYENYRQVW